MISNVNTGISESKIQNGEKDVFFVSWHAGSSMDYFYHQLRYVVEEKAVKLAKQEILQHLPAPLTLLKEKTRYYTRKNLNELLLKLVAENRITLNNGIYDKR